MTAREWSLKLDLGRPPSINTVYGKHWATKHHITGLWTVGASVLARNAGVPKGLDQVSIVSQVHRSDRKFMDLGNELPAVKAAVDGLVRFGMVPDDDPGHVVELRFVAPVLADWDGLLLTIEEVV